ncbi:FkbM family methyltransferase [Ensifer sp. IC4062]|nr:FkbM family methyltransferase [Ensifer sp. IC4062]MCA1439323.1 FkbM family methyltransferase [Ensifer sp. IC4062]
MQDTINTIFGSFSLESKKRLDLTFDYETCAIRSFREVAAFLEATQVVDIGANIGVYSIYASSLPNLRQIHAFEPAPEAFKLLKKNIALQTTASKIRAYDLALSSQAGQVQFNLVSPLSGANGIVTAAAKSGEVIRIQAKRLDDVLSFSREKVCVKIDVEGHEFAVLSGAIAFLQSNQCYVQVESLRPSTVADVQRLMKEIGYSHIFSLQNDHLFVHSTLQADIKSLLDIIAKHLAQDLHDLTELRLEKRRLAAEAKKLWQTAGYRRDPLLS